MNFKKMTRTELKQIINEYAENPNPTRRWIGSAPNNFNGFDIEWTDEQNAREAACDRAKNELYHRGLARISRRQRVARKIDKHNRGRDLNRGLCKKTLHFHKGGKWSDLRIKNTSHWPTILVNLVVCFVLKEIERKGGRSRLYDLTVQHTSRGGHGHAYPHGKVHVAHNRSQPRMNWKYVGISWAKDNATKTALQSLCHIIAHELIHTTSMAPAKIKNGRRQIQSMEYRTDNLAAEIVSEFAKHEFSIWSKYRKHRRTQRNQNLRKTKASAERKTSDAKMDRAEANLARWQAELEKAQKHVKKWQVKVNRMQGARKAAAKRAANRAANRSK